jgi:lysozyme
MTAVDLVIPRLRTEEGFRALPYKDTQGHLTVGFGCNLDVGLSRFAAEALLTAQAGERHNDLLRFPWYAALDPVRQSVCLDIDFNAHLLTFPHMIAALAKGDWATAAAECKVTNPELAGRYATLAQLLLTG